jgi:hypothetical protein
MDWAHAIERNRAALLAVAAAIAALIGGRKAAGPIARRLRSAALALLRPAEAAARRLIVMAARGLAAAPRPPRPFDPAVAARAPQPVAEAAGGRIPAFPLFDRWKHFRPLRLPVVPAGVPRIRTFWGPPLPAPAAAPPPVRRGAADPDAPVDPGRLRLRLLSLERALAALPREARRLARRLARAAELKKGQQEIGRHFPRAPLRPGLPPGWRRRPGRDVDEALRDCHALACAALRADSS